MYSHCVWEADGTFNCVNAKKKLRNNDIVIPKRNLKSTYPSVRRIIAIGDIHGDIKKLTYIFVKAKLIKRTVRGNWVWIGKDTYVVQVGDQIDFGGRGVALSDNSKELEVLLFLDLDDVQSPLYLDSQFQIQLLKFQKIPIKFHVFVVSHQLSALLYL